MDKDLLELYSDYLLSSFGATTALPYRYGLADYAAGRLESLRVKHRLNHVALRSRRYLKALRCAFDELRMLKTA